VLYPILILHHYGAKHSITLFLTPISSYVAIGENDTILLETVISGFYKQSILR